MSKKVVKEIAHIYYILLYILIYIIYSIMRVIIIYPNSFQKKRINKIMFRLLE